MESLISGTFAHLLALAESVDGSQRGQAAKGRSFGEISAEERRGIAFSCGCAAELQVAVDELISVHLVPGIFNILTLLPIATRRILLVAPCLPSFPGISTASFRSEIHVVGLCILIEGAVTLRLGWYVSRESNVRGHASKQAACCKRCRAHFKSC